MKVRSQAYAVYIPFHLVTLVGLKIADLGLVWYVDIQLLESPIPAPAPAAPAPSQKASSDDISGTKRGTIDPLVSKRRKTNSKKKK